jgi:pyridoxine kinase
VPLALVLSSFVAASRVGGGGQQYVLAAHGIDPVLVPTVMFGRHPGKGAPGGAAVAPEVFESAVDAALEDVALEHADAVLGGYFASAAQVAVAARAVERLRAETRRSNITGRLALVVDPILGDTDTGLYVKPDVAGALIERLVPLADWLTPNLWELETLVGDPSGDLADIVDMARTLPCPALVTSVPVGDHEIGLLCVAREGCRLFVHPKYPRVPRGTGDLVAASFTAGLIEGLAPLDAAERAARAAAETARAAVDWESPELPLVALGERLRRPTASVRIQEL